MIYIDEELDFRPVEFRTNLDPDKSLILQNRRSIDSARYQLIYYNSYIFRKEIYDINITQGIRSWTVGTLYINCEEELLIIPYSNSYMNSKTDNIYYNKGFDFANFQKWVNKIGNYQPSIYDLEMFNR